MDIIERLEDEELYVDAIDDAIAEIKRLRAENAELNERWGALAVEIENMTDALPGDEPTTLEQVVAAVKLVCDRLEIAEENVTELRARLDAQGQVPGRYVQPQWVDEVEKYYREMPDDEPVAGT